MCNLHNCYWFADFMRFLAFFIATCFRTLMMLFSVHLAIGPKCYTLFYCIWSICCLVIPTTTNKPETNICAHFNVYLGERERAQAHMHVEKRQREERISSRLCADSTRASHLIDWATQVLPYLLVVTSFPLPENFSRAYTKNLMKDNKFSGLQSPHNVINTIKSH